MDTNADIVIDTQVLHVRASISTACIYLVSILDLSKESLEDIN